ncbi:MAG: 1-acyl-sn-glycerol-3-phosphate acyltransferase, partial [Flavobacteriales bacterium]|nr:1-acyl-sn-glycerol-3-phosphate acyltransferase [Flavobacteriales bacterium]
IFSPMILAISMVRVKAKGLDNVLDEPAIYAANHASQLDIPIICTRVNRPMFFIGKIELKKIPILSQYMKIVGMIFVDRKNRERAMASMRTAIQDIQGGKSIAAFPEGTRTKTGELLPFKKGVFTIAKEGRIPIVPIAVIGSARALASGSFFLRPATVELRILPALKDDDFFNMSIEEMANHTRSLIQQEIEKG